MLYINKKIDITVKSSEGENLHITHVKINNVTYGTYPSMFNVILQYLIIKSGKQCSTEICGKLYIDADCKPEFLFDIGGADNAFIDRKKLSQAIFNAYNRKAIYLLYGPKAYSLSITKVAGINLKWLRAYYHIGLEDMASLIKTDTDTIERLEIDDLPLRAYNRLDLRGITKKYGVKYFSNHMDFISKTKYLPVAGKEDMKQCIMVASKNT